MSASAQSSQEREAAVCEARNDRLLALQERFVSKRQVHEERLASLRSAVDIRRAEIDEVITETAANYDERYQKWYEGYIEETNDEVKQAAATAFYQSVQTLLADRRAAYREARTTFRSTLDSIREERVTAQRSAADTFRAQAEAAYTTVTNACGVRGRDAAQTRREFIDSLRSSRLTYAETRRSQQPYRDQIQTAIETRTDAYKVARQTFEQGFQQALSTFREAENTTE